MEERTDGVFERMLGVIRKIDDPVEMRRQLLEMLDEEFPAPPVFTCGERMPMHTFMSRFQRCICGGIVPRFYNSMVQVIDPRYDGSVVIKISPAQDSHEVAA